MNVLIFGDPSSSISFFTRCRDRAGTYRTTCWTRSVVMW